jgi:NAD(P)-dependent dehydrogenase (short-subunit alcohol dehydrogenase family)
MGSGGILQGQVAIITGGGRGIGRAIAKTFAAEGAAVVLTARTEKEVANVAEEVMKAGGRALAVVADVSQERDCERIVDRAREAFEKIDILVNNAGVLGPVLAVEDLTPDEWDQVFAVNLRAPFLLSRLVVKDMYLRNFGAIVNIATIAAKAAFQLNSAYAASKAGLMGLTRTLAAEGARRGVRVNAISPGPVAETKMLAKLKSGIMTHTAADEELVSNSMYERILQGRPQKESEIADAALFLVSERASAITGQILNVDGGMAFY